LGPIKGEGEYPQARTDTKQIRDDDTLRSEPCDDIEVAEEWRKETWKEVPEEANKEDSYL